MTAPADAPHADVPATLNLRRIRRPRLGFAAIYADFPWAFEGYTNKRAVPQRAPGQHYETMTEPELAALPIASLAARDCALFLWVIDTHLPQALRLIAGYGFTYRKVVFIWDKRAMSLGHWTRNEGEICLLATRGRPKRLDKGVRQIHAEARREHSRKPEEFRDRVERLVAGPYLELFGRQARPGWQIAGDQADKFSGGGS